MTWKITLIIDLKNWQSNYFKFDKEWHFGAQKSVSYQFFLIFQNILKTKFKNIRNSKQDLLTNNENSQIQTS